MIKIVVLSAVDEPDLPGLEALAESASIDYARDEARLRDALLSHDILVVTDFRDDLLRRCWPENPSIRWVHATSAGVDALMFPALVESDITVTNARGIFDQGIAEYVLGAILAFAKDTFGNIYYRQKSQWKHRETALIKGKKALIVGTGSIGSCTGRLLAAVGIEVNGIARSEKKQQGFNAVYPGTQLLECLAEADYVVIAAPLTSQTRHLFDERAFAAMKPTAFLINVGRGPIVKTPALLEALEAEKISGAALDVFEEEPLPTDHPLWQYDNVMISAHMAGDFIGWRRALGEQFVENFRHWQNAQPLFNQVKKQMIE